MKTDNGSSVNEELSEYTGEMWSDSVSGFVYLQQRATPTSWVCLTDPTYTVCIYSHARVFFKDDKLHRLNGPAIDHLHNPSKNSWYVEGREVVPMPSLRGGSDDPDDIF